MSKCNSFQKRGVAQNTTVHPRDAAHCRVTENGPSDRHRERGTNPSPVHDGDPETGRREPPRPERGAGAEPAAYTVPSGDRARLLKPGPRQGHLHSPLGFNVLLESQPDCQARTGREREEEEERDLCLHVAGPHRENSRRLCVPAAARRCTHTQS